MILASGCGNQDKQAKEIQENTRIIPAIDEYDPGMSRAHFLSYNVNSKKEDNIDTQEDKDIFANAKSPSESDIQVNKDSQDQEVSLESDSSTFDASCRMLLDGNEAYLVLGDEEGEYGRLILCGISSWADEDKFVIRSFSNGKEDNNYEREIPLSSASDGTGVFDITLHIDGNKLFPTINNEELETVEIPQISLGCVGTYKNRGMDEAYMDDILVKTGDEILFAEDFDGNFANNLYEYNYAKQPESAFSPYYYKTTYDTKGKSLVVSSGFLLSETRKEAAPVFKREFDIDGKKVESAYLYLTALGSVDAIINGEKVSDYFFDPGRMVYDDYLNYVSYDVTEMIGKKNEIKLYLFHGFFDRGVGYPEVASPWGDELAVKGELVVNYKDGTRDIYPTDEEFKATDNTRYRFDDIYQGEIIDDRYDDALVKEWTVPLIDAVDESFLTLQICKKEYEPVAPIGEIDCIAVTEPVAGHFVYDFGENLAGTIKVDLSKLTEKPEEGTIVTFRYGELLNSSEMVNADDAEGTVWTRNLFTARSTDYYVFGKEKESELSFSHTYHGFRYLEVTGLSETIPEDAIKAIPISSKMQVTGEFSCSDEVINKLYANSVRSLRTNMIDIPTDCCQRDERLGWTGDAQAVSAFALYQLDAKEFYRNFLKQLRTQQLENGEISDLTPTQNPFGGHSCWGDAMVTIPWNMYLQYGDIDILKENIDAACRWVDYLVDISDDYIVSSGGYGDHLSNQTTDGNLSDTAWSAHSAMLVSKMCKALGDEEGAEKYNNIFNAFKEKWQETYIRPDASVDAGILEADAESETAYSLGIAFELFPEDMMEAASTRLDILSQYGGYLFYPGYSGMVFYLPALADYGHGQSAIQVMTNTAPGGLAHPLSMGLTTNPEEITAFRYQDDGRYYVTGSLNHAAYSSTCVFCYTHILGIRPDEDKPGYEHFYIVPSMLEALDYAEGSFNSAAGLISVKWNRAERTIECGVPENSTCTLVLPDGTTKELQGGESKVTW